MRLLIANRHLDPIHDLLEAMELRPAQSRARSKLLELVKDAQLRFGADEYDLVTAHAILDDTGKPFIGQDGTFQLSGGHRPGRVPHPARTALGLRGGGRWAHLHRPSH